MLFKIFVTMDMFPPDESYIKSKTFSCTTYMYMQRLVSTNLKNGIKRLIQSA